MRRPADPKAGSQVPPHAGAPEVPAAASPHGDALFRSLFSAYPDCLLVVDGAGTVVLCNEPACTMLGYPQSELVGLPVEILVPDAVRDRHAGFRHAYGKAPQPRPMGTQMELAARRKDGSEVMVEIALSPLNVQGQPLVVAAIRDVAAYPRMQQALQRARYSERLAEFGRLVADARDPHPVLDQVPLIAAEVLEADVVMVFLLERDGRGLRVASGVGMVPGEEIGTLLPYAPAATPGLVLSQGRPLTVEDYRLEHRFPVPPAYLEAGLTSGLAVPISDRGRLIGALSVRWRRRRHPGDDERRFLVSLASLLAASLQRVESEDALNHAQRLESIGHLSGGIAHDFNNLLTVIQGNLQVLAEHGPLVDDAQGQTLVGAALRAARRGAELTRKLLAFSRRQVLQPSDVDVGAMLDALADMLRRTLDQKIRIDVETDPDCPPVLVDPVQLESALLNIAINSRDAMPDGGTLCLRARPCASLPQAPLGEASASADDDEGFVAISVADSGTGMSEDVLERALEPFFTTKEPGRGTGLGLSTAYGFARQSRGTLSIDSAPGSGTTVTLYIPRSSGAATPLARADVAPSELPNGIRVLLVEDDADVRSVISNFLRALGCQVETAASAEHAVRTHATTPSFDLLLTDISLGPGMRGPELAAILSGRDPALGILLMSGFPEELLDADRHAPIEWELLTKPCSREELAAAMAKALAARRGSPDH